MFLEECKYVVKEKKMSQYIFDHIEISSDSDEENSDKENSNEESSNDFDEEYFDEENADEKNQVQNVSAIKNIKEIILQCYLSLYKNIKMFFCIYKNGK